MKTKDLGLAVGFDVGAGNIAISHLQFADDTILFSSSDWEELAMLTCILRCFG